MEEVVHPSTLELTEALFTGHLAHTQRTARAQAIDRRARWAYALVFVVLAAWALLV